MIHIQRLPAMIESIVPPEGYAVGAFVLNTLAPALFRERINRLKPSVKGSEEKSLFGVAFQALPLFIDLSRLRQGIVGKRISFLAIYPLIFTLQGCNYLAAKQYRCALKIQQALPYFIQGIHLSTIALDYREGYHQTVAIRLIAWSYLHLLEKRLPAKINRVASAVFMGAGGLCLGKYLFQLAVQKAYISLAVWVITTLFQRQILNGVKKFSDVLKKWAKEEEERIRQEEEKRKQRMEQNYKILCELNQKEYSTNLPK